MAPEQHAQLATDERADQFSFCVALWEAIYSERPFPGDAVPVLADAVLHGRRRPTPRRPRVPGWLRRALDRGMSVEPDARFPTMPALLDAVRPRRSRVMMVAAGAGGIAMLAAGALALAAFVGDDRDGARIEPCSAGRDRIASVWNPVKKRDLGARLIAAGAPQAQARWATVERSIDRYARGWLAMYADACEASGDGAAAQELSDRRTHCLDTGLADLQQVLGLLDTSDPVVAENAFAAVDALRPVERCSSVEVLEARTPVPADPAQRAQVEELRRDIVRADALRRAGRFAESRALFDELRRRAEAIGYRPAIADVLYYLGLLETETGSAAQGEATIRRAAHSAEASRYDELAADAWILLITIASQETGDLAKAAEYGDHARAALDRLGGHTRLEASYQHHMGVLDWLRSRPQDALARFHASEALFKKLGDVQDLLAPLEGTGLIYEELGRIDDALRVAQEVLAYRERTLGPDHPDTALSLGNAASALLHLGRHTEALALMQRALTIRERANGPDHLETARAMHNIGEILRNLGRYQESLDQHQRSLAIFERELGPDHQGVAASLENTAGVYLDLGRVAEALPRLRRALEIYRATVGDDSLEVARARINLADGLRRSGRFGEALDQDRRALAVARATVGEENLYTGHALLGIGQDLLGLKRPREARDPLERAARAVEKSGADAVAIARAEFGLARALHGDRAERARSRSLATKARGALEGAAGEGATLRAEIDAWLVGRSPAR